MTSPQRDDDDAIADSLTASVDNVGRGARYLHCKPFAMAP
jgi:hypothetical protein